ncbi:lipase family protein [Zooshikella sp. RANM57]|uniref:lipase family protein n=1 Tax=Zooshikella sp. RANM57 TaxID=3425863 RepID=UPI003D6F6267
MANNPSSSTTLQCPKLGSIRIKLIDPDRQPYTGITLQLIPSSGGSTVFVNDNGKYDASKGTAAGHSATTDSNGEAFFELPLGQYSLKVTNQDDLINQAEQHPKPPVDPNTTTKTAAYQYAKGNNGIFRQMRLGELVTTNELPKYHKVDGKQKTAFFYPFAEEQLYVVEIYPLRAYVPALSHTEQYCDLNAYNLGLFATMSYAKFPTEQSIKIGYAQENEPTTVKYIVEQEWAELKQPLQTAEISGARCPWVLIDVPYSERFQTTDECATFASNIITLTPEESQEEKGAELQAYIVHNPKQCVIFVRGTDPVANWFTDFNAEQVDFKHPLTGQLIGKVHLGFYTGFRKLFDGLIDTIKKHANKKLYISGHSLGGAMATMFAASLSENNPLLYTYGSPRPGSQSFISVFDNKRDIYKHKNKQNADVSSNTGNEFTHHRIVNHRDPVTSVPCSWMDTNWKHASASGLILKSVNVYLGIIFVIYSLRNESEDEYVHHGNLRFILPVEIPGQSKSPLMIPLYSRGLADAGFVKGLIDKGEDMPNINFLNKIAHAFDHTMKNYMLNIKSIFKQNYQQMDTAISDNEKAVLKAFDQHIADFDSIWNSAWNTITRDKEAAIEVKNKLQQFFRKYTFPSDVLGQENHTQIVNAISTHLFSEKPYGYEN